MAYRDIWPPRVLGKRGGRKTAVRDGSWTLWTLEDTAGGEEGPEGLKAKARL